MKTNKELIEQVTYRLSQLKEPGAEVSFLISPITQPLGGSQEPNGKGFRVFWSQFRFAEGVPMSPTVKLIQGVFDRFVDLSFFHLRNRIFSTGTFTEMDRGMIQVVAKRGTDQVKSADHGLSLESFEFSEIKEEWVLRSSPHLEDPKLTHPEKFGSFQEAREFVIQQAGRVGRGLILHDHNRPIAAVLMDDQLNVLSSSTNSNYKNKSFHAEVLCLQDAFLKGRLGGDSPLCLLVSLKPCRMCSGMFLNLRSNLSSLKVLYLKDDPGSLARGSTLEKLGRMQMLP